MGEVTPPLQSPPSKSEDSFNISNIPNLDGNDSIISNEPNLSEFEKIPVHVSKKMCTKKNNKLLKLGQQTYL